MTNTAPNLAEAPNIAAFIEKLVASEGSGAQRFAGSVDLNSGKFATRNLADVVHYLCTLHGRYPGVIDLAAHHTAQAGARQWLLKAEDGFVVERNYLTKLVVIAGPLPSTPGQAESESAVNGQRHALDMLAQSDRDGCALGAAITLALDWQAIRVVLDRAAHRWGLDVPECTLPSAEESLSVAQVCAVSPAIERALSFGAQQILNQHRGLWDLLDARQIARGDF